MNIAPIIIGSERSEAGLAAGFALLAQGGSALDAVEAIVSHVHSSTP